MAHYLTNKNLLEQIRISKLLDQPTNDLCHMFLLLTDRIGSKNNFVHYSYLEEMKGDALVNLCNGWNKFNEDKSSNPFSFFTQIVHNSFVQRIKKEKSHMRVKNEIYVANGMLPSFSYQTKYQEEIKAMFLEVQDEYETDLRTADEGVLTE